MLYMYSTPVISIVICSTAQLLEPFCREYDIRVSGLGSDIDGRPSSIHTNAVQHATTPTVSSGGELEDPPGLYEKVMFAVHVLYDYGFWDPQKDWQSLPMGHFLFKK